ncbi:MAG: hypothetical protein M3323_10455 [Actinomycetota bacterium]|nr:hypothetical protein [Actinomycetota bacterium]
MPSRRFLRPALVVCCVLALVPGSGASASGGGGGKPHVQTYDYLYSHGVDTYHYTVSTKAVMPPIVFTPRPQDRWMHLAADDALGKGVLVHVYQRGDRGERDLQDIFCAPANLYRLVSRRPIEVHLFSGACPNHTFGFATTGTLTATFSPHL